MDVEAALTFNQLLQATRRRYPALPALVIGDGQQCGADVWPEAATMVGDHVLGVPGELAVLVVKGGRVVEERTLPKVFFNRNPGRRA